jgi:hypothetical protein
MTTQATTIRTGGAASAQALSFARLLLLSGAPAVAVLGGMAAEWLDFRALRVPLLLMVGAGVLATAYAVNGTRRGWRPFAATVLIGAATWAGAQTLYAIIHTASGERFHADSFGPQWSQAIALIAAHGAFLGAPTGAAAAVPLWLSARRARPSPG